MHTITCALPQCQGFAAVAILEAVCCPWYVDDTAEGPTPDYSSSVITQKCAFDNAAHDGITGSLEDLGSGGSLYCWMLKYLTGRPICIPTHAGWGHATFLKAQVVRDAVNSKNSTSP